MDGSTRTQNSQNEDLLRDLVGPIQNKDSWAPSHGNTGSVDLGNLKF